MPLPASRTPPLAARAVPRGRVYAKCRLAIGRQGGGRRDGTRRCVLEGSRGAAGLRGTGTARAAGPGARWKSPGCLGGRRDGVSGAAPRMPRPRAGGGGAATASGRFRLGYMGTENAAAGCTPPPARRWRPPPAWVCAAGWVRGGEPAARPASPALSLLPPQVSGAGCPRVPRRQGSAWWAAAPRGSTRLSTS